VIYRPSTAPLLDSCSAPILLLDITTTLRSFDYATLIRLLHRHQAPSTPLRSSTTFLPFTTTTTTTLRSDTAPRHLQQLRQRSAPILLHDIFNNYDNAPLRYCSTTPSTSATTTSSPNLRQLPLLLRQLPLLLRQLPLLLRQLPHLLRQLPLLLRQLPPTSCDNYTFF
jgi:hypothetical protein